MLPDKGEQKFSYNASGHLASTTYPDGSTKGYLYNEQANTSSYNRPGFLTGITDENGKRYETIKYLSSNRAYYTEFAGGVDATTLEYASLTSNGTLPVTVKSTLGAQSLLKFSDTGKGRILPAGGSVACGAQCNQPYKSMTYDANGHPASTTDFRGVITRTTYTADGLLAVQIEAYGTPQQRTTINTWDAALRVPLTSIIKDSTGTPASITLWTYNSLGLEASRCEVDPTVPSAASYVCGSAASAPAGVRQWTSSFCTSIDSTLCPQIGLILAEDGPRTDVADVTTYSYYLTADESGCGTGLGNCHRAGDLNTVTNALGHSYTRLAYDWNGRPTRIRDEVGTIREFAYSPRGKLTSTIERAQADGAASTLDRLTTIKLDPAENVVSVTDPDGVSLAYSYDDAHRLTRISDVAGNSIQYVLDAAGNRTKEEIIDPSGSVRRSLSRVYDKLGNMTSQRTAAGYSTDFSYDTAGNVQVVTDAVKRRTQLDYDALGRLSSTLEDVGGAAVLTRYTYDAEGRTTGVTDPKGLSTSYQYSGLGDIVAQTSPDTGVSRATYDGAGQLVTRIDANGRKATSTFDALGRIVRKVYGDQEMIASYVYDQVEPICGATESFAKGRLSSLQDESGVTQYCYDQAGNVTRKANTEGGTTISVEYGYTKAGRLSMIRYPDGTVVEYVRDALGNTTEIGVTRAGAAREVLLSGAIRHPFGPSSGWSYGNGRALSREVDKDYRPLTLRGGVGGIDSTYSFNLVGELVTLGAADTSDPSVTLTYDSLGRLNALKDGATGAIIDSYTYDATGNRLSAKVNGVEQTYVYPSNSHRLSSVSGAKRTYDLAGNLLSVDGSDREFSYNAASRMSTVRIDGTVAAEFRYNEMGQQTSRSVQGDASRFLYDEKGLWLGTYDQANTISQQIIWLDQLPVGVIEGGSLQYVEPDHLGAPRAVVNPTRNAVVWTWNLKGEAFGATAPNEDPDRDGTGFEFSLRLPGQRFEASTGLNQNHHRDYDASIGRYVQSDPIGLAGSISTYGYVDADPMSRIDPTGLDSIVTHQNLGTTSYYDDNGNYVASWDSRSAVARNALAGAAGPYQSADVYPTRGPYKNNSTSFGPNDILKTDDTGRGRWIHGGGTGLKDPRAPRQGWKPTMGCTRMQNEDIQELVDMVRDAKSRNPSKPIRYQRLNYQRPVIIPVF